MSEKNIELKRHSVQKIGEHAVALECYKRGWTCAIISGTQPDYDMMISDEDDRPVRAEVKTRQWVSKTPPDCLTKTPEGTKCPLVQILYDKKIDSVRFFIMSRNDVLKFQQTVTEDYALVHPSWKNKWWIAGKNYMVFEDRWDLLWEAE